MSSPPFIPGTHPPRVEFTNRFVQPPTHQYLSPDDFFSVIVQHSGPNNASHFVARQLDPDGKVTITQRLLSTAMARVEQRFTIRAQEGYLLGTTLELKTGDPNLARNWGSIRITRSPGVIDPPAQQLVYGYYTEGAALVWPGGQNVMRGEGRGDHRVLVGTDPGAGAIISYFILANTKWHLHHVRVSLTTGAAAGNTYVFLDIKNPDGYILFRSMSGHVQPQGTTYNYTFAPWGESPTPAVATEIPLNLSPEIILRPGWNISISGSSMTGTKNLSAPVYTFDEWVILERFPP